MELSVGQRDNRGAHGTCWTRGLRLGGLAARMYGWAAEELAGRQLPASPEQLEEEERNNACDKAGFLSFMEFGGFDLRQVGY